MRVYRGRTAPTTHSQRRRRPPCLAAAINTPHLLLSCRPAITNLIMQITQHLSNPSGNPQLALTFQPLVNMALNMQLSVRACGKCVGGQRGRDRT